MQPCQFCGNTTVDQAGFCTNCRNYRGVPAAPATGPQYPQFPNSGPAYGSQISAPPAGYPQSVPPASLGYPQSAPPAGQGYPQSAPPVTAAYPQNYQPPGYPPTAAYQQPGYPPVSALPVTSIAAPPPKRNLLIPVLAACVVLVLVAIGIALALKSGGSNTPGAGPSDSPSVPVSPAFDQCLVGTWKVTASTVDIPLEGVGDVPFSATTTTERVTIQADGSSVDDYGPPSAPTSFTGSGGGHTYRIDLDGTVTYTLRSANGVLSFESIHADGNEVVYLDGTQATSTPLTDTDNDPTPYTCSSTTVTQKTTTFSATMTKIS